MHLACWDEGDGGGSGGGGGSGDDSNNDSVSWANFFVLGPKIHSSNKSHISFWFMKKLDAITCKEYILLVKFNSLVKLTIEIKY